MTDYIDKGCSDGTILGQDTTSLVGFWGVTPVAQAAALTADLTAITVVSATASLSTTIQVVVGASAFGFQNITEAQSFLYTIQRLQIRQAEVETKLINCGLLPGGTAVDTAAATNVEFIGKGDDEGDILGQDTTKKIGFWGTAPVDKPSAFTAPVTSTAMPTIVVTVTASQIAAGSGLIGIMLTGVTSYGFVDHEEGQTFLQVVAAVQTRLAEVEDRLQEIGIIAGGTGKTAATRYDYLDKGNDGGTVFGKTTNAKIGFWGTTGQIQPATALTTAALTIVVSISTTTSDFAIQTLASTTAMYRVNGLTATYTMLDAVQRLQIRASEIEARMETLGLLASDGVG